MKNTGGGCNDGTNQRDTASLPNRTGFGHPQRIQGGLHRRRRTTGHGAGHLHLLDALRIGLCSRSAAQRPDRRDRREPDPVEPRTDPHLRRRPQYLRGLRAERHGGGRRALLRPQDLRRGLHSAGLREATAGRFVSRRIALCRRQLLPHVPSGVPGARDGHRTDGGHGTVPAAHRQRRRHPAGDGRDAAGHLPVAQPFHSLSGLRIVHHARDHHRHHPADAPDRHRHDRRHMARIRTLPETDPRQLQAHVHASDRAGKGVGLHLDLRRHAALHHDGALQTVPLSLQRLDGGRRRIARALSAGLHHAGNRHFGCSATANSRCCCFSGHRFPSCCSAALRSRAKPSPNGSTRWGRSSRAAAASTPSSGSGRWALRCGT